MHELGIAQSILETARRESAVRQGVAVHTIGLRIGILSGVLPDALSFGFDAMTAGTDMETCQLAIDMVPARGACRDCGMAFEVEEFLFVCPECHSGKVDTLQGFEMEIAYLEIDEPES